MPGNDDATLMTRAHHCSFHFFSPSLSQTMQIIPGWNKLVGRGGSMVLDVLFFFEKIHFQGCPRAWWIKGCGFLLTDTRGKIETFFSSSLRGGWTGKSLLTTNVCRSFAYAGRAFLFIFALKAFLSITLCVDGFELSMIRAALIDKIGKKITLFTGK